jgi:signal transduction histidine kinase
MVEGVFARMPNLEKMAALVHLAGAVAHELNNIFTAVTGNLSLLDEHIERGSAPSEMIGEAIRTAQRGIALSAKLQAFAGRQPLRRKQIDVNRILRGIACDLRNDLPKTVELIFLPASSDCQSFADEDKLRHTILELGANAVAAMNGAGKIYLQSENRHVTGNEGLALRPGDYIIIRVCDTGSGMTSEVAARAIDPMFSTKASHIDAGWGLSNCAGFMRQSGGTMKIFSELGHGTAVDLYLPILNAADDFPLKQSFR